MSIIELFNGVAHTEIKFNDNNQPYIIESQTRVGGDRIWKMLEITTEFKQIDAFLQILAGKETTIPKSINSNKVCGFFPLLPKPGIVKDFSIGNIKPGNDILEFSFNIKIGKNIKPIKDNSIRYGVLLLKSTTHKMLYTTLTNIYKKIWVKYEDETIWQPTICSTN